MNHPNDDHAKATSLEAQASRCYECVIIGGGLVGQLTALALAQASQGQFYRRIAIVENRSIDKPAHSDFDNRSIALAYPSIVLLYRLGLGPILEQVATPIHAANVTQKGNIGQAHFSAEKEALPYIGSVIEMPDLLNAFLKKIKDTPTIDILAPCQVTSLIPVNRGYGVKLKYLANENQLDDANAEPDEWVINTNLLIGCDGAQSRIRQWLDIETRHVNYHQSALTFNVALKRSHHHIAYERFLNDGVMALLPLAGHRCGCIWTMPSEKADALACLSSAELVQQLQKNFGYRLGKFLQCGQVNQMPLHLMMARSTYRYNVLLFGNALHFLHPVSGQGFNLSVRDIGILYDLVAQYGMTKEPEIIYHAFAQSRQKDQNRAAWLTHSMISVFNQPGWHKKLIRTLGLGMLERTDRAKTLVNDLLMGKLNTMPSLLHNQKHDDIGK